MKTSDNKNLKKKKLLNQFRLAAALSLGILLLVTGHYLIAVVAVFLLWLGHELLFADHVFYDPRADYGYDFSGADTFFPDWQENRGAFHWPEPSAEYDTLLLAVRVRATLAGRWFDPWVEITGGGGVIRQYFERGADGLRYLNLSHLPDRRGGSEVLLGGRHCQLVLWGSELLGFKNPDLRGRRVMVIAPHADDAEIAAFGLYSETESYILTLTAGEVEAESFQNLYPHPEQASLLKGRLRAWDSIAVPLWGGVKAERAVNLGYFCNRLQEMNAEPARSIASKTAGIEDTRLFRQWNAYRLPSDENGEPNWNNLLADIGCLVEKFKPQAILTPHPQLDPHGDHRFATLALAQALRGVKQGMPDDIYFYANHHFYTDIHPFGPAHTLASLPPWFAEPLLPASIHSVPLTLDKQKDKACALAMMHDLRPKLSPRKKLRKTLQAWLIGRPHTVYGEDDYFRKAVRGNELFFRIPAQQFLNEKFIHDEVEQENPEKPPPDRPGGG